MTYFFKYTNWKTKTQQKQFYPPLTWCVIVARCYFGDVSRNGRTAEFDLVHRIGPKKNEEEKAFGKTEIEEGADVLLATSTRIAGRCRRALSSFRAHHIDDSAHTH